MFFLKKRIVFESMPDFADSTIQVYNELVKRGYSQKYKFVWLTHQKHKYFDNHSITAKLVSLKSFYYRRTSKYLIFNNQMFYLGKKRKQKMIYISHGAPVKHVRDYYYLHGSTNGLIGLSPLCSHEEAYQYRCPQELVYGLGFPRNDAIINSKVDLHNIFNFKGKIIFYYPTIKLWASRPNNPHGDGFVSNLLKTNEDCAKTNEYLKKHNILLVMKLHWASGGRDLLTQKYSSIIFVDEAFFASHQTTSYECLGKADALLTDYSSVFYDYLIVNKPIGFIWTDFEQYRKTPGLVDLFINQTSKCGSKIYNFDDLFTFINNVKLNKDPVKKEREKLKALVYPHKNPKSTERVTDFIIKTFNL